MKELEFKVTPQDEGYEATCIQHPFITFAADTEEEAVEGAREEAVQYLIKAWTVPSLWQV